MKKDKIIQSLENMNDRYITEAAEYYTQPRRKSNAIRFGIPAAACCVTAAACALVIGINGANNGVSAGSAGSTDAADSTSNGNGGVGIVYSDTKSTHPAEPDPVETSKPKDDEPNDGFEYAMQFQRGGFSFSDHVLTNDDYNGGAIEYSFVADSSGNEYDVEFGYRAFLNGVPQLVSVNGGEPSEMALYTQSPNKEEKVTISIIPRITEDLVNEETLELKIFDIFNPSYAPQGTYIGFGNAHNGEMFSSDTITINTPIEDIIDIGTPLTEYEYNNINVADNIAILNLTDTKTRRNVVHIRDDATTAEMKLTLNGKNENIYRIYAYVNHERVKIEGEYDYVDIDVTDGSSLTFDFELQDIKNRDIAYVIAVPLTEREDEFFSKAQKSNSVLILTESDPAYNV